MLFHSELLLLPDDRCSAKNAPTVTLQMPASEIPGEDQHQVWTIIVPGNSRRMERGQKGEDDKWDSHLLWKVSLATIF